MKKTKRHLLPPLTQVILTEQSLTGQGVLHWEKLLQTWGIEQTEAQTAFAGLVAAYSSPGRVYHTLEHIQAMLQWIESLRDQAHDLAALQLSVWFHDSVYDPHAADNEEQSAAYAQSTLSHLGLPPSIIQIVARMILSTKTHQAGNDDVDYQILLDADLAILGAPSAEYENYARAIRKEYSWVAEAAYRTARVKVLQTFLQRSRIYWTEPMFVALEGQARENMRREIATLS
jgi:predicted metal-dependent HD superfamily phosphohydrolase